RRPEVGEALSLERIDIARQREVARALRAFLPEPAVLWEEEDTRPYECDGLTAYRQVPMVVALPETEEQVQRVLQTCTAMGVPVVPRGAGTGLSGGALPPGNGVLLSMAKFMRIVRVDSRARIAVVQPGVRNAAISEAAAPYGLYYAPDPSSQIACTVGGNVAENSGGVHCLKYGLTVHNVVRVRGFTMRGEAIELGSEAPDAPGYDLLALAIGSEGMLMVVTEVAVRLLPEPQCARVIMASFDDVGKAGQAVADVIAAGIIPAGLEMMDQPATRAVEQFVGAGYDLEAAAILLCESDGTPAQMEAKYGLRCPNVFHAGDGNLHPLILFDANDADELRRTELFAAEVLEKCIELGGTITGEHGVGVEKINQMCVQFQPDELELF